MTKIITHPEPMTPTQQSKALLPDELPPCTGNPGVECPHPIQPVMISGYDDKMRCPACNKVHVALVEQEAGNNSNPNSAPQFISAKLNTKVEQMERQRILKENEPRDGRTRSSPGTLAPGDAVSYT
ncbi:MAG: hypothetical protein IMY75_13380, partial [Chloroflexi bacterium]|nr:hypothetical protein [Chloroflexota bacterium]